MVAVVLVGVGLTIPAIAGRTGRARAEGADRHTLEKVEPIWARVMADASPERRLEVDDHSSASGQLHRMLIDIWDADLAAGPGHSTLTPEEREYLLSVETSLDTPAEAK
jgi:hypothetical protein